MDGSWVHSFPAAGQDMLRLCWTVVSSCAVNVLHLIAVLVPIYMEICERDIKLSFIHPLQQSIILVPVVDENEYR